ncbi:hypothetical protein [Aliivibrio sifiae]|uniref:hypothetical protein n=1 Tax=Aliivibrio sifiae TaxID=566293 RepID=UPI003D0A7898
MIKLELSALFAYSENNKKGFFTTFSNTVNIIHGRNTSGKSTLIQMIIYCFGVNDGKEKLTEILDESVIVRLDCKLIDDSSTKNITFIRDHDSVIFCLENELPIRFDGINSPNANEYKVYKQFFCELIGFDLQLESDGSLGLAPIEASLLPYYISQSVGWVYLRESIGEYRFYKGFKLDYLDYYFNIVDNKDRLEETRLLKKKKELKSEEKFLTEYEEKKPVLRLTRLLNNRFEDLASSYLDDYMKINSDLIESEKKYTEFCNKKSLALVRKNILNKIKRSQSKQKPSIDGCPVCEQILPGSINNQYKHDQQINNTIYEISKANELIKKYQSNILAEDIKIKKYREIIIKDFKLIKKASVNDISFETWMDYQVNTNFIKKLDKQITTISTDLSKLEGDLKKFKNSKSLDDERKDVDRKFYAIFNKKCNLLGVKIPKNERYRNVYDIKSFPFQGVELHKVIMAYHFSFNELIGLNQNIHRFPFLLDAVFKEDIDEKSKELIYSFLSKEKPKDTQMLFSVADYIAKNDETIEDEKQVSWVKKMNTKHFSGKAKLICIGHGLNERAFLSNDFHVDNEYLDETLELVDTI